MKKYDISLYEAGGKWTAVIQRLLVHSDGETPEKAVGSAITAAKETEQGLATYGTETQRPHAVGFAGVGHRTACGLLVEYGIRTAFLAILIIGIYLVVRSDLKAELRNFRNDVVAEISMIRRTIEPTVQGDQNAQDQLRERARALNERLMPAAIELRPLFRLLFGHERQNNN